MTRIGPLVLGATLLVCIEILCCSPALAADYGLQFDCTAAPASARTAIASGMRDYLAALEITPELYHDHQSLPGIFGFSLKTPEGDTSTLDFHERPDLSIRTQIDWITTASGEMRNVLTVTEKEIVLALMQRGRLTRFSGMACTVAALREHVGLRRNIVAWAERVEWGWPNGRSAAWNCRYWKSGTPLPGAGLWPAIQDAFFNPAKYSFGCYTAAKLIIVQGVLDYYHRVNPSPEKVREIEARLLADGDPLVDIEPGQMWSFEPDIDAQEMSRPGKLLRLADGVAARNFVPGDWVYFFNTDPVSHAKTGYEGSNPIYLGRNRFADYYNDNDHHYSFFEKLDDVHQWRNGVFSRRRDAGKIVPLTASDYERLSGTPADGGLLLPLRAIPYYFGFERLPHLPAH